MPTRPPHLPGTGPAYHNPGTDPARHTPGTRPAQPSAQDVPGPSRAGEVPGPSRPGEVLAGRYRIDGLLGHGGTAEVLRATDLRLGRPVAVKRFLPGGSAATEATFHAEALLLAGLRHPGLVTVYDAGRDEHGTYLVMELVEGTTLRAHLAGGPLPAGEVVRLGTRLAAALAHVHAAGIVHRDVKPSNILLGTDGEPYLADFGLSRSADDSTRAEPGTLLGTIAYMAPEQVRGEGATAASDVHALGLVLLECVKGAREYRGTPSETATAKLVRPPDTTRGVPPSLVPVVAAMTHPDPAVRPTAAECAHALGERLRAEAGGDPVPPRPRGSLPAGGQAPAAAATPERAGAQALFGLSPAPAHPGPSHPGQAGWQAHLADPAHGTGPGRGADAALPSDPALAASTQAMPPEPTSESRTVAGTPPGREGHAAAEHSEPATERTERDRQPRRRRLLLVASAAVLAAAAGGAALTWGPSAGGGGPGADTGAGTPPSASSPATPTSPGTSSTSSGVPAAPAKATATPAAGRGAPPAAGPVARGSAHAPSGPADAQPKTAKGSAKGGNGGGKGDGGAHGGHGKKDG